MATDRKYAHHVRIPGSSIVWCVIPSRGFVEGRFYRKDGTFVCRRPTESQRAAAFAAVRAA